MASVTAMQRKILSNLLAATAPKPLCCTGTIKALPSRAAAERRQITLFMYANQELTDKMFRLPQGQYPLEMFMNHFLVYSCVVDYLRAGQLGVEVSELMTGTLAQLPMGGSDPHGGMWGTSIDTESATWTVPRANLVAYRRLLDAGESVDHLHGTNWLSAMLITDWSNLPKRGTPDDAPRLQVVHVPTTPPEELSDSQWKKLVELTYGYNNVEAGQKNNSTFCDDAINDLKTIISLVE